MPKIHAMEGATDGINARAEELEAAGRRIEAIDLLTEANRSRPSAAIEERLMTLRHEAFGELGAASGSPAAAERVELGDAPGDDGLPAIDSTELTAARVAGAIGSYGAVLVRGLVDPDRAAAMVATIDRAFAAREALDAGGDSDDASPYYRPFVPGDEAKAAVALGRGFISNSSGVLLADSPRVTFELFELFEQVGLRRVITDYLGERPAISVNKGTLRRSRPGGPTGWHQDGAFLGRDIRALNIWLSLTHCGERAPGMELVPKRIEHIVETGTRGAQFDWSVSDEVALEVAGGRLSWPIFEPGDALLFDQMNLHRAAIDPEMTETRYATESWFFAPSAYPDPHEQVPLVY